MKMELIEGSETSATSIVTPGNYPKENILHTEHGESLKSGKVGYIHWNQSLTYVQDAAEKPGGFRNEITQ